MEETKKNATMKNKKPVAVVRVNVGVNDREVAALVPEQVEPVDGFQGSLGSPEI